MLWFFENRAKVSGNIFLAPCPSGQISIQFCTSNSQCPSGYGCQNGGCCPLSCPTGTPSGPCDGGVSCPTNYQCIAGACCPIPLPPCPTGGTSVAFCTGNGQSTCAAGYYCVNGGCCPLPICPSGQTSIQVQIIVSLISLS